MEGILIRIFSRHAQEVLMAVETPVPSPLIWSIQHKLQTAAALTRYARNELLIANKTAKLCEF